MKRRIIYGVLAVLIAIGLWMYVVTVVNPEWEETYSNIPVYMENEEILHGRGLMLAPGEEPKVTLRLSGNRTDMIKLSNANITIRADLSRIYSAGEQTINYSIVYPGDVASNAFEIVSQTSITLTVVERKSKPVDVVLNVGEADPGYKAMVEEAVLDVEKITVVGPADLVDRVDRAQIDINLAGQTDIISQQFDYVLLDAQGNVVEGAGLKTSPQKIQCTLKIQKIQDVTISMDVLTENSGLKAGDFQILYYNQETNQLIDAPITIAGLNKQLEELKQAGLLRDDKLFVDKVVDLSQKAGTPAAGGGLEIVETINLEELLTPYEITNQSDVNVVKVVVKLKNTDLMTKEYKVTNIVKEKIPEGAKVNITSSVKVTIRGPHYEVKWIELEDFTVVVNFADATIGKTDEFVAEVILNMTGRKETVVIGTYKVTATVTAV